MFDRNLDMKEATLEVDGVIVLRFAIANGFRNIQNLVQKLKSKRCTYDYVEIMACPSGNLKILFRQINLFLILLKNFQYFCVCSITNSIN